MAMSGLLIARATQVADEVRRNDKPDATAKKLWDMLERGSGQAVLEEHLLEGPIIDSNYEFTTTQQALVKIGVLTPCVIRGRVGATVANYVGLHAYNAAFKDKQEKEAST